MRPRLAIGALAACLLLLGCSGAERSPDRDAAADNSVRGADRSDAGATVIAALGDSITAGSPLWDPEPAIREQIGSTLDERSQFEHWASAEHPELEFRNCGVLGERTDEIAQRLDSCSAGAGLLIVQGGINDVAQEASIEAAAENLRGMVRAGKQAGLAVAITDVLPWNNGFPAARMPIEELNRMIAAIADGEGVPLMPFYATLQDPDNPGLIRPEWTTDGDHPSIAGYRRLAEQAVLPNLPG